ncbi:hypothetical protein BO70DRAFT_39897 [Aspergillus heteromorphus CBS 117.55]|uniref:Uncharacterized protein n=1 Tax=Aspergillus heteromorphus CBS 117.55 TaxID=1448321 RepID=A0A317WCC9_9EURO|nr:uncharacterized protein BO70DRAFT_39897 [Aspergillus heteromorphus CBS 117.55]PWY81800.1 hypothetical protein BO70DRAFT_39897 [Aspergillus heteromorphus CBS 117.55]
MPLRPPVQSEGEPSSELMRSQKDVKVDQAVLENDSLSVGDSSPTLSDEALSMAQGEIFKTSSHSFGEYLETASAASDDSSDHNQVVGAELPIYIVRRSGWNIIDYHLYLVHNERGKDECIRRNSMFLYDGLDCRPCLFSELYQPGMPRPEDIILFNILPIIERHNPVNCKGYVLGFDVGKQTLFARQFQWIPDVVEDVWCVWDEGIDKYSLDIKDLLTILRLCIDDHKLSPGEGILTYNKLVCEEDKTDDPGMELVIVVSFCQWILDVAGPLFAPNLPGFAYVIKELERYMKACRSILQRASKRAWEAIGNGYTKQMRKRNASVNQYTDDLYTFVKSEIEVDAEQGQPYAPGLDTCHRLRRRYEEQRKEHAEQRLQSLFAAPDKDSLPESAQDMLQKAVARSRMGLASGVLPSPHTPPASSPPQLDSDPADGWGPPSPEIVTPSIEKYEDREITEYDTLPLPALMGQALSILAAHPSRDNPQSRARFGEFLGEIGVYLRRNPAGDLHMGGLTTNHHATWELCVLEEGQEARGIRRLLPGPVFD